MKLRRTKTQMTVLRILLDNRDRPLCGADFINEAKLFSGTLYPILERLEERGIVKSWWEAINPQEEGRPRRKFYELTGVGETAAKSLLNETSAPVFGETALPIGFGR